MLVLDPALGAVIAAAVILFYSFSGGIRASIWTDALQSFVMIGSMFLLLLVSINSLGGVEAAFESLTQVEAGYMQWFPKAMRATGSKSPDPSSDGYSTG